MPKVFSTEDGNQTSDIRITKDRVYSDIDLTLEARPADGDIYKKLDAAAVKQSIKNILLTNFYEKPYRPTFGGNLGGLLFDLMDDTTGDAMVQQILDALKRYEPRAQVLQLDVDATPDYNDVTVRLEFRVIATGVVETLKVNLNEPTPTIGFEPITTVPPTFDDILLTEDSDRVVTLQGLLLSVDFATDGLITNHTAEPILTQNGLNILP